MRSRLFLIDAALLSYCTMVMIPPRVDSFPAPKKIKQKQIIEQQEIIIMPLDGSNRRSSLETSTVSGNRTSQYRNTNSKKSINEKENNVALVSRRFQDLLTAGENGQPLIHTQTLKALEEVFKFDKMTDIQAQTLSSAYCMKNDVLGRAPTGTGKTLAYLIPALETVIQSEQRPGTNVGVLVIAPTRELANQISDEASKLLSFHKDFSVQVIYGGTSIKRDTALLCKRLPTILVATPGRLLDHLKTTKVNSRKFMDIVGKLQVLVLDESDKLLQMGFRHDIQNILSYLPKRRQTLMFSATIPKKMNDMISSSMKQDYSTIDCVKNNSNIESITQRYTTLTSMDNFVASVLNYIFHVSKDPKSKVLVFFPVARMVGYFSNIFQTLAKDKNVLTIHSRKSQGARARASQEFREASGNIVMFTTDVSERGVDYPDVTHVLQFGMPESRDSYIHRIGRTGRLGKDGISWLVLFPFEKAFIDELKGLQIREENNLDYDNDDSPAFKTEDLDEILVRIRSSDRKYTPEARLAYQAFLGYYSTDRNMRRAKVRSKKKVVELANEFARYLGLANTPTLGSDVIRKLGLLGVEGIVESDDGYDEEISIDYCDDDEIEL